MKTLLKSVTFVAFVCLATVLSSQAASVVYNQDLNGSGTNPYDALVPALSTDDLILNGSSTLGSYTYSAVPFANNPGSVNDGLTSGNSDFGNNNAYFVDANSSQNSLPETLTFTLTGSSTGYDITAISSIAGWDDSNDASQDFSVYYTTVGSSTFTLLGTYTNEVSDGKNDSTQTLITDGLGDGAAFLTNVTALEFVYTTPSTSNATILHELDVDGVASAAAATPEPSTYALFLVSGLAVLAFRLRRQNA